tara:strand:- start:1552 stop:1692 length:141 start_codon:yes stop_codon:yes gene_type:complete
MHRSLRHQTTNTVIMKTIDLAHICRLALLVITLASVAGVVVANIAL